MRLALPVKLMASYIFVAGLIVAPAAVYLRGSLSDSLEDFERRQLEGRAAAVRDRIAAAAPADLDHVAREVASLLGLRVTVIDSNGAVVSDSDVPRERVPELANHADRPEVAAALKGNQGFARRISVTVGEELLYLAVPLAAPELDGLAAPGSASSSLPQVHRGVVRVAARASALQDSVSNALRALRLATGLGISVALGFSLVAALYVSSPLRRMRDAARALTEARWASVGPLRTGDELEELSSALDELGQKLHQQLVDRGGQESLVVQAVEAFPIPAVLLEADRQPLVVNGAYRRLADLTASNQEQRLSDLTTSTRLLAACQASTKTGLPTELVLDPPAVPPEAPGAALLCPLMRGAAPPLWLLIVDPDREESAARGPEAVQRLLRGAEQWMEQAWDAHPTLRDSLAQLRARLDDVAHAAGRAEAVGVEPRDASALLTRAVEELRVLYPEASQRLSVEATQSCAVAESAGLAARAVRLFLGGALRALPAGRTLEVELTLEATEIRLRTEGSAPPDLAPLKELVRALGTSVGRVEHREREAAWLTLPRA